LTEKNAAIGEVPALPAATRSFRAVENRGKLC
jgi:hypothetical protein